MLNGRLALHDIRDTEAFALTVIQRSTLRVERTDLEEVLTFLVEELWILSTRFNPERSGSFARYAGHLAGLRLVDWHRQRNGQHYRTGSTKPTEFHWNEGTSSSDNRQSSLDHVRAELGGALDPAERSDADLLRLLRSRAGTPPPGHPQNPGRMARPVTR